MIALAPSAPPTDQWPTSDRPHGQPVRIADVLPAVLARYQRGPMAPPRHRGCSAPDGAVQCGR
jgi:hypothetical protein